MVGVYKLVNRANCRVYIGKSKDFKNIWAIYDGVLENDKLSLQEDLKKYGARNFEFSLIEECLESQLQEKGDYYADKYREENTINKENVSVNGQDENVKIKRKRKSSKHRELNDGLKKHLEKMRTDPEYRAEMVKKYKNNRPNSIAINMIDKSTGEILMTFPKIMDGAAWIRENTNYSKADYATINKICNGNGKTAYGFKWEYVNKKA